MRVIERIERNEQHIWGGGIIMAGLLVLGIVTLVNVKSNQAEIDTIQQESAKTGVMVIQKLQSYQATIETLKQELENQKDLGNTTKTEGSDGQKENG